MAFTTFMLFLVFIFIIIILSYSILSKTEFSLKEKDEYGGLREIHQKEKNVLQKEEILNILNYRCREKYNNVPCYQNIADLKNSLKSGEKQVIESAYILILNQTFDDSKSGGRLKPRKGSEHDVQDIKNTFTQFKNFIIEPIENATSEEIKNIVSNVDKKVIAGKHDALLIFIMSHGGEGFFAASDEEMISYFAIENYVCTEKLRNIPKMVIVNACRNHVRGAPEDIVKGRRLQTEADLENHKEFFFFFSTMKYCASNRNETYGSWFINACCAVIREAQGMGLQLSLDKWKKKVTDYVSQYRGKLKKTGESLFQLPEVSSERIISKYYFPVMSG